MFFKPNLSPSPAPGDPVAMSANNPSTASLQQASPDNAPLGAGPTLPPDINAGATGAKHVRQTGPDTAVCANNLASRIFHTAGLSQARDILGDGVPYLVCLPTDHLWDSCPLDDHLLAEIKSHVVESGLLSEKGEWSNIDGEYLKRENYAAWSEDADEAFAFFSRLFNTILGHLRQSGRGTSVQEMVHAVSEPESNRRPDAFLHMATETPPVPGKFRWRDLTCPFEYKFANGGAVDVSQPGSITCPDHFFIFYSTESRRCGVSTTLCGATPVECFHSGPPYVGQSSASGFCVGRHPSRSPPLTGLMSVQLPCFFR